MKKCSRCEVVLDESSFARSEKNKDGLRGWCKKCESDYQKSRKSDPEYLAYKRAAMKKYYASHKSEVLERNRKYSEKNKERIYAKSKTRVGLWHKNKYEKLGWLIRVRSKFLCKVKFILSPDDRRKNLIRFRSNNPNYYKNWSKKYFEKYPERVSACRFVSNHKRRASAMAVNDVGLSKEEWLSVMKENDWKCEHCGSSKLLSVDHFFPLSKGFPLSVANYSVLCKSCNSSKHDKLPTDFRFSEDMLRMKRLQFFRNGAMEYVKRLGEPQASQYLEFLNS